MRSKHLVFSKNVPASFTMFCAFLLLISTQSLSLAHDPSHNNHDETELCEILNTAGNNGDWINSESHLPLGSGSHHLPAVWFVSIIDGTVVLDQRSRAPPLSRS